MRNTCAALSIIPSTCGVACLIDGPEMPLISRAAFIIYISYSLCGVAPRLGALEPSIILLNDYSIDEVAVNILRINNKLRIPKYSTSFIGVDYYILFMALAAFKSALLIYSLWGKPTSVSSGVLLAHA